jgi:hypothetical protein
MWLGWTGNEVTNLHTTRRLAGECAAELYGRNCPVILIESAADWRRIAACPWLHLSCRDGEATIDLSRPCSA